MTTDIFTSGEFKKVIETLQKVKSSNTNIIFVGESGTGKTVLSRMFYRLKFKKDSPLVEVNLSSIPEDLIESELFGFEKGSFTGAYKKKSGILERSNGGMVILENIDSVSLPIQAKLLKFIEEREITHIGSHFKEKVDVFIVTHFQRDPYSLIEEKKLRKDLFFRLNTLLINLKPLDRWVNIENKIELIKFLIEKISKEENRRLIFSKKVMEEIANLSFPGNIRELENFIRTIFLLSPPSEKKVLEIPQNLLYGKNRIEFLPLSEIEKRYIYEVLNYTHWNKTKASKILGISRKTLIQKCKRFGLDR